MKRKSLVWFAVVISFLYCGELWATEFEPAQFTCPVCGTTFWAKTVASTSITGTDRDFRPLHSGDSPLDYMAITCPVCRFTAYPEDYKWITNLPGEIKTAFENPDFPQPPEGVKAFGEPDPYREEVLKSLASKGEATNPADIRMAARYPAWAGLDMLAQTYERIGKKKLNIGWVYLEAVWAIRRDSVLVIRGVMTDAVWEDLMGRAIDMMMDDAAEVKKLENESDQGVELAVRAMKKSSGEEGYDRAGLLLFSIFLNRYHGENTRVLEALPHLEGLIDAEVYAKLNEATTKSINRERRYMALAAEYLVPAINEIENPEEKANHLYLCGEVNRRLENWKEARKFFELADQLGTADNTRKKWIKEQMALLPGNGK